MAVYAVTINKLKTVTQEKTCKIKWYPMKINNSNKNVAEKDKCTIATLY